MATELLAGDPQRLDGYWLAGRLGAGGQGVVYEAYSPEGRRVAIKVLHGDQDGLLGREAEAARRVSSFCIAQILDARLDGPRPYIVSEYVEGPSLRRAVEEGRRFIGADLHRLATAVATALTAIHEAGVIHRDLKPDNVLLAPDGPRVIDFGIARTMEMSLTATGLVTGTPTYMAPEVFTGHRAGPPADVFAWGGIMLFAATGADPFEAESLGGVMHRVLSTEPEVSMLEEPLRSLVAASLGKDPQARPSARQLLLALVSADGRLDTPRLLSAGGSAAAGIGAPSDDPGLGTVAERAYETLDPEERTLAAEVFLRLVTVDDDGEPAVRRAALAELTEGRPLPETAAITRLLTRLDGVISVTGEDVRLANRALPQAWPRYRRWIDANRDGLAVLRGIGEGARRWDAAGRRDADLFRGSALENALHWAATARKDLTLSGAERDFLAAGAALTRRRTRRARLVTLTLAVLLVLALAAGGLAVQQNAVARAGAERLAAQLTRAEAARLADLAQATRRTDPRLAARLAVAAWRLDPTPRTRAALTTAAAWRETSAFQDPDRSGETVRAISRDGRLLASVGGGDAARLWDLRSGVRRGGVRRLGLGGERVAAAALSGDGRTLVAVTARRARAWDTATGRELRTWSFPAPLDLLNDWAEVEIVGGAAIVATSEGARRWDLATGEVAGVRPAETAAADGSWTLRRQGRIARLTHARTGRTVELGRLDGAGTQGRWNGGEVTVSADGSLAASVTVREVQIWRMAGGQLLTALPVLGATGGEAPEPPRGGFDGRTFRYLVEDRVFAADLTDLAARPGSPGGKPAAGHEVNLAALSPDGRHLVTDTVDGGVELRRVRDGGRVARLASGAESVAFAPDGGLAALVGADATVVADPRTGPVVARIPAGVPDPAPVVFSRDGSRLALAVPGGVQVWDPRTGRRLWTQAHRDVADLAFSPDGRRLAVAGADLRLLDAATGRPAGSPFGAIGGGTAFTRAFFTHSGRDLVTLDSRARLTRWDTATGRQVNLVQAEAASAPVAAYSPREDLVAVHAGRGRVHLLDPISGTLLGSLRDTGGGRDPRIGDVTSLTFTPDGATLLTADRKATVRAHPAAPAPLSRTLCGRTAGGLTPAEWRTHVPALPYRPTC
ncbi:WD40 repeat domain-containing serine/threonine protein kinase [Bailinhaonella thermotolerans]|uniref:Protein kinase domain-containing protein n=1 Tax=Bailinhaonella thermotolerans TaxID=1070861 RepID=A0A3A4B9U9_9ACTN|nr:WD40 repeat domain-containing serine/threonine protein kinase [Bailinhaonella thermotolerans]RJL35669.1 hypothetical protein D5H75_02460 [Bailinhaonella thermotolerans]